MARMQSEVTAEILCDIETIYNILQKKGFFFKEQLKQIDHYYTHLPINSATTYKELALNSFLLREIVLKRRYMAGESSVLLYKRKRFDAAGNVIGEEKVSCDIEDTASADAVFQAAGLNNWCVKSITGHIFKKGNQELLIQEVDGLGIFVEIEEFEQQKGTNYQRIEELIAFAKGLGLPLGNDMHVKINYLLFQKRIRKAKSGDKIYWGAP